ncbi:tripartite tricarboxylate transporter substrate binding protein BugD [Roseomonas sp. SSH11]|uniref:Tripartite tricarboxylate transporter substrate binding protein BugD n=1 Tax=Pararoseomonas baculiformis TaxID=2820812 RepID=A0ABS4AKQ0_9PROT|nr:tripartite tricarboxylate transporter substrate-binding protein [Pararoseomonas baculiformis]MBP0447586.1 tripartite tricarboxylate transporter substrate binding protein BugD [Pararoseomonas baculiformis]
MRSLARRRLLAALIAMGVLSGLASNAAAQDASSAFPTRPISMVVGFAPGGPADVIARLIAPGLSVDLGQTVVVENAGGAGGSIGQARVASARPDGHTILFGSLAQAIIPTLLRDLSFDPLALEAIGMVNEVPMAIIARRNFPASNLAELAAVVRREGARLNLGNAGVGSTSHLCSLLLSASIGTPVTLVPYRGNGPVMNDLMAGRLDLGCDQTTNNAEQIRSGTIRAYAITTPARAGSLPDVPTTAEAGLPTMRMSGWNMLFAPAGTPRPIVERLNQALLAVLRNENVLRRMADLGSTPASGERTTPAGAQAFWHAETARWKPLVQASAPSVD